MKLKHIFKYIKNIKQNYFMKFQQIFSPSRCGAICVVMKNWEPLVSGPVLAMESSPGMSWFITNL